MRKDCGFSLIELMIAVAIIAILAAIATPIYQGYIARTQAVSALDEISIGKAGYEYLIGLGSSASSFTADALGLHASSARCRSIEVNAPIAGASTQAIGCVMSGVPDIQDEHIRLERSSSGRWQCRSTIESRYLPAGCLNS